MGADSISFELDGNKTFSDVLKEVKRLRAENAEENGHAQGYSGDWQTIPEVKDHSHEVFADDEKAFNYCLEKCEKWHYAIAVKYQVKAEIKPDAKLKRLRERLANTEMERREYTDKTCSPLRQNMFTNTKLQKYYTCRHCKSKVNTKYLTRAYCTVCNADILPKKYTTRIEKMLAKVQALQVEIVKHQAVLNAKAKVKGTRWLVAGWAAC